MGTSSYAPPAPYSPSWEALDDAAATARAHRERLRDILRTLSERGLVVAFSGGIDSSFLLHEALQVLGTRVVAVTALSETFPAAEHARARQLASDLGARLVEVKTRELENPDYRKNAPDRCFFCKHELFARLELVASDLGISTIAYGAIADDLGDHRPGGQAAAQHNVRAPLQEAGLTKDEIRWLSRETGLPTWNLPSQACLSSRFAYGEPIEPTWLRAVESAETFIRSLGIHQVRVRHHGNIARIEVDPENIAFIASEGVRASIVRCLNDLGYTYITLDMAGFRSGSMNLVLQPRKRD